MSRPISPEAEQFGDLLSALSAEEGQFTGEVAVTLGEAERWWDVPRAAFSRVAARLRDAEAAGLVQRQAPGAWRLA